MISELGAGDHQLMTYQWIESAVQMPPIGDASGGLRWLPADALPSGDVAETRLPEPDTALLPTAGLFPVVWGGDAA